MSKLGGWQRIFIVFFLLYSILTLSIAYSEFPKELSDVEGKRVRELISKEKAVYVLEAGRYVSSYDVPEWEEIIKLKHDHFIKVRLPVFQSAHMPDGSIVSPDGEMLIKMIAAENNGTLPADKVELLNELRKEKNVMIGAEARKQFMRDLIVEYHEAMPVALRAQRLEFMGWTLLFWLIPMTAIYMFGWSFGWIYRGFKKS